MNNEMMFDLTIVHFEEINNNPEYFEENKNGLKAKVIWIDPYDYIQAVLLRKINHSTSESKLENLKSLYDKGIKVPMPYLIYGDRDEPSNHFGQEGFNRAYTATLLNKKTIPVAIRYRETDENIPNFIKKHLICSYSLDVKIESLKNTCKDKNINFLSFEEYSKKVDNSLKKEEIEPKYLKYLELSISQIQNDKDMIQDTVNIIESEIKR